MIYANNLDPDEAPDYVGPHLRSILVDTQIIYQQTFRWKQWMLTYFAKY